MEKVGTGRLLSVKTTRRLLGEVLRRTREDCRVAFREGLESGLSECERRMRRQERLEGETRTVVVCDRGARLKKERSAGFSVYLTHLQRMAPLMHRQRSILEAYLQQKGLSTGLLSRNDLEVTRRQFNVDKATLITEWSQKAGIKVPLSTYRAFDWHHIIPLRHAGPNLWFNILPLRREDHVAIHCFLAKARLFTR